MMRVACLVGVLVMVGILSEADLTAMAANVAIGSRGWLMGFAGVAPRF